jgi:sigma-B regulation protein RsbU (phosphoserine phosphatase)
MVIPLLLKDRCLGVFDLESPELGAFTKKHVELLTLLASQAAVAIENARLYEEIRANELRLEKEMRFAQRVQMALLPQELPKRLKGVDVAWHFDAARELGGDVYDFLSPEPHTLVVSVGDVSGKGVPAALYGAFASGTIRARAFEKHGPAALLTRVNRTLHRRGVEGLYCTVSYALFDFEDGSVRIANSGLPYAQHYRAAQARCEPIEVGGLPLGSFEGANYDERTLELGAGDVFVFATDGAVEAYNGKEEYGPARLRAQVESHARETAQELGEAILEDLARFMGDATAGDDLTLIVVKIK